MERPAVTRIARRYATTWAVAFLILLAYWQAYELVDLGTQYANPLWPCAWLATWPANFWLAYHWRYVSSQLRRK